MSPGDVGFCRDATPTGGRGDCGWLRIDFSESTKTNMFSSEKIFQVKYNLILINLIYQNWSKTKFVEKYFFND